jgi:hypothetical protein
LYTRDKHSVGLPAAIVGIVAVLFLLFVYGYPRLFPRIEASDPAHFEENVAQAEAQGDLDKALKMALSATRVKPLDIKEQDIAISRGFAEYGRLLLKAGRTDEGFEQLEKALGLRPEPLLLYKNDRRPFYFTPARLALGQYWLDRHKPVEAVANFELARPYATPDDSKWKANASVMYRGYAELGLWARALEFGAPSDAELGTLDAAQILRLERACVDRGDWALAERVLAQKRLPEDEAAYWAARIALAGGKYADAAAGLERAAATGRVGAAYLLGAALEAVGQPRQARDAYLNSRPEDPYRPFALVKAATLQDSLYEVDGSGVSPTRKEFMAELDGCIAALRAKPRPATFDRSLRFVPVAFDYSEADFTSGGKFPVLVLWEAAKSPAAEAGPASVTEGKDSTLELRRGNALLRLQWVENRVEWASVETLPAGTEQIPGWIDSARDWFDLRSERVARVAQDETGNRYLNVAKPTWVFSVPVASRNGVGYLVAARVKCAPDGASLEWQGVDAEDKVWNEGDILAGVDTGSWAGQAGFMRSLLQWDFLRLQLIALPGKGEVSFDDVMLVEIGEPE